MTRGPVGRARRVLDLGRLVGQYLWQRGGLGGGCAAHAMTDELVARITAAGLPHLRASHGRLFENLDPQGTRLSDLAARAQMTYQSMSELYGSLEKAGYVERTPDPADGRAKLVCLTPLGRRMLRFAVGEITMIEAAWFGKMPRAAGPEALRVALQAALRDRLAQRVRPMGCR